MNRRERFDFRSIRKACSPTLKARFRRALLRRAFEGLGIVSAISLSLFPSGCTRQQYRCKTDTEAYYLLDEKVGQSCETNTAQYRIEVDSRSRMFDPFNPDRPPMPEDDPQANRFLQRVDGKKGYPLWEANGRTNVAENPQWWNYLPLDERGVLVLDLNDAVRTALLHSPGYQSNLEEMYLSALDVSSERFLLDSQFFGGWQAGGSRTGNVLAGAAAGNTSLTTGPRGLVVRKAYASGADLLVNFANTITWQVAGADTYTSPSTLSFSLLQPLLRNGGRDLVLERLTLAERALLSNVRAFERYRRGFYIQIATGRAPDVTPNRRGGAFGGAGLGGFDILGSVFTNARGGGGIGGGGGVPGAGGYLGILQSQLQIDNQKETIIRLQDLYLQLRDNYRELLLTMPDIQTEIPSQQVQVAQAQQSVYDAQTNLLSLQAGYEATLDGFKSTLGLPPYLCIEIRDNLLDQFKLISQELRDRRTEIAVFRASVGENNSVLLDLTTIQRDETTGETFRTIESGEGTQRELERLKQSLEPLAGLLKTVLDEDIPTVRSDIERLTVNVPLRRRQLNRLKDIAQRERGMVCSLLPLGDFNTSFLDGEGLEELPGKLTTELDRLENLIVQQVEEFDTVVDSVVEISGKLNEYDSSRKRFEEISRKVILGSQDLIAAINENILAVQLVQARARTESTLLPEVDLEPRDALEIARRNRRDWLNSRANLVDRWRAIEVVADDLESVLDFSISGQAGNVGDNPFALHSSNSRLTVGLAWDAPITRLQERNNYRAVLISYQQAKRSFYQFEDRVWSNLRNSLRTVRQNQLSFEIQRFAVQNAAQQISVNEDIRQINETLGQSSGPTAARDAVQGLRDFLNTQSQLIGVYVNYEANRRALDLDLGTMEVDDEGLWIDPGPIRTDTVGGVLGEAILQYGLAEGEALVRDDLRIVEEGPLNVVPSEQIPPMSDVAQPDTAASGLPVRQVTPIRLLEPDAIPGKQPNELKQLRPGYQAASPLEFGRVD